MFSLAVGQSKQFPYAPVGVPADSLCAADQTDVRSTQTARADVFCQSSRHRLLTSPCAVHSVWVKGGEFQGLVADVVCVLGYSCTR